MSIGGCRTRVLGAVKGEVKGSLGAFPLADNYGESRVQGVSWGRLRPGEMDWRRHRPGDFGGQGGSWSR